MADKSKTRMNLAAIKKLDPYAKDIVDTSSHVAFYIFNSEQNEWEKTDVEGAFFIYSRNAQPFHSIFINNRLNTTSFVEPITNHLELQAQAPFLLYRNERSRIRGFWFYNSLECERISKLVSELVQSAATTSIENNRENAVDGTQAKEDNYNLSIFKMLSDAQQIFNITQQANSASANNNVNNHQPVQQQPQQQAQHTQPAAPQNIASGNVLKFFAAAKPTADISYTPRILPNTLSVEQVEKQQRDIAPGPQTTALIDDANALYHTPQQVPLQQEGAPSNGTTRLSCSLLESVAMDNSNPMFVKKLPRQCSSGALDIKPLTAATSNKGPDFGFAKALQAATCSPNTLPGEQIALSKIFSNLNLQQHAAPILSEVTNKPALMPPTMFDKAPATAQEDTIHHLPVNKQEPLNKYQFVQAFNYLIQNDEEFVQKLHDAYLKTLTKFGTYQ
uniref:mRNA-decapping enzyme C-terminal domain-containing protein n=1 Tax=Glossina austeni TaxID=7395 RepID=A0A1A9UJ05_GLOAU